MATRSIGSPGQAARTPKIKLQPPRRPAAYVFRPRLERILDSASERRLTTVIAGPGYGKSTLVATRALEHGWSWYAADPTDAALAVFARGLRDALFADSEAPVIPDEALRGDSEGLAASFGQALDATLAGDRVLVVDDVHELGGETESARFLEGLSRQAPAELHLVLCSREEAPFSTERLHGQGQAVRINSSGLAFTTEEVQVLLLDAGPDFASIADELHDATGGWPAAVQLGAQMLVTAPGESQGRQLSALKRRDGPVFAYLAVEVFRRESPDVLELLRTVAPLERFNAALCAALGLPDRLDMLAHLQRRGFVIASGDTADWLRLHPLLHDFVLETWPLDPSEWRSIQRSAAGWWESNGFLVESLGAWRDADEPDELVRLLNERWSELHEGGYAGAVIAAAASIPDELMDVRAKMLIANCHGIRGEKDLELRYLKELAASDDVAPPWVSFNLGVVYTQQGRYREGIRAFLSDDGDHPMHLAFAAYGYFQLGELEPSRECSMRALTTARECGDLTAEAEAHMCLGDICIADGDLTAAEDHVGSALEMVQLAGNVLAECSARTRMALLRLAQGRYGDALAAAEESLALAERIGFAIFLAWAVAVRGEVYRRLGRLDEAAADLALSAVRYERMEEASLRGFTLVRLGQTHQERGDLAQALSAFETALALGEKSENTLLQARALAVLAGAAAAGEPQRAAELVRRSVEMGGGQEGVGEAVLMRGWIALERGDRNAATADAAEALAEARRVNRREWLAEALELQAWCGRDRRSALEEARMIWLELGNPVAEARVELALALNAGATADAFRLRKKLRSLGIRDGAFRAAGPLMPIGAEEPSRVVIRTLGGFGVQRGREQVPAAEWQSKKARVLLKLLVAARGRPLAREQLIEALWPMEPPEHTSNRLSVALSTVRAALDPTRRFDTAYFVIAEDAAIRIRLEHVEVDVETFLADADASLRAWRKDNSEETRSSLAEAEQSYAGDFLPEDRYESWTFRLRDEARAAYVEVTRALAEASTGQEAARYYLRILEGDPYDEQAHAGLVSAHARAGAHGEARRAYMNYTSRMSEIDVEPIGLAALQAGSA